MRIYYQDSSEDKLLVERLLNNSIVPYSLDAREKMAQLYYAFTKFDEYSLLYATIYYSYHYDSIFYLTCSSFFLTFSRSLAEIMKNRVL